MQNDNTWLSNWKSSSFFLLLNFQWIMNMYRKIVVLGSPFTRLCETIRFSHLCQWLCRFALILIRTLKSYPEILHWSSIRLIQQNVPCVLQSFGLGWAVGSQPLFWALFISFVLGTAYSINVRARVFGPSSASYQTRYK